MLATGDKIFSLNQPCVTSEDSVPTLRAPENSDEILLAQSHQRATGSYTIAPNASSQEEIEAVLGSVSQEQLRIIQEKRQRFETVQPGDSLPSSLTIQRNEQGIITSVHIADLDFPGMNKAYEVNQRATASLKSVVDELSSIHPEIGKFNIVVIKDDNINNAFAYEPDTLVISESILKKFDTKSELVSLLTHESCHLIERHTALRRGIENEYKLMRKEDLQGLYEKYGLSSSVEAMDLPSPEKENYKRDFDKITANNDFARTDAIRDGIENRADDFSISALSRLNLDPYATANRREISSSEDDTGHSPNSNHHLTSARATRARLLADNLPDNPDTIRPEKDKNWYSTFLKESGLE